MHCDNILVKLRKQTSESEWICVFSVRSATASEYFLSIKQTVLPRLQNINFSMKVELILQLYISDWIYNHSGDLPELNQ